MEDPLARATSGSRAPFQVLVIPFHLRSEALPLYCLFRRRDAGYWQWIAGSGENDERPADAAHREATEEAGYTNRGDLLQLQSMTTVPVAEIAGFIWGEHVLVVVEHSFAIRAATLNITLSSEHDEYRLCDYETAMAMLKWDSNRTALWELNHRILHCLQTLKPA